MTSPLVFAVIEDDVEQNRAIGEGLERLGYMVRQFFDLEECAAHAHWTSVDVAIIDQNLGSAETGFEARQLIAKANPAIPMVIYTGYPVSPTLQSALCAGAFVAYLTKGDLRTLLNTARRIALEIEAARSGTVGTAIAESRSLREALRDAAKAGACKAPLMIVGEAGSGKEIVAQRYCEAASTDGRTVSFSCPTFARDVVESELFGHERGSFTGAIARKRGLFEQAHGYALFLDEIGELALDMQAKLLRVLETRTFRRVGGSAEIRWEGGFVAATNRDLRSAVRDGRFREDLYYRLAVVQVQVPPLRERPEDIVPLAQHFLSLHSTARPRLSEDAERWMLAQAWPGNVRQLKGLIWRVVVLDDPKVITSQLLQAHCDAIGELPVAPPPQPAILAGRVDRSTNAQVVDPPQLGMADGDVTARWDRLERVLQALGEAAMGWRPYKLLDSKVPWGRESVADYVLPTGRSKRTHARRSVHMALRRAGWTLETAAGRERWPLCVAYYLAHLQGPTVAQ